MSISHLPAPVRDFFHAMKSNDVDGAMSTFHPSANLMDADYCFEAEGIAEHLVFLLRQLGNNLRAMHTAKRSDEHILTVIAGPGAGTAYNWYFGVKDASITHLRVASIDWSMLPPPVKAYIDAANNGDLAGLMESLAEDALVNDQLFDYWGKEQILPWAASEIIGEQFRLQVLGILKHYDQVIVTASVDGTFDKKGLPDPLILAFYFCALDDKIVQLIILRNHTWI